MRRRRHFQTWHFEQDLFSRLLKERREENPFCPFYYISGTFVFRHIWKQLRCSWQNIRSNKIKVAIFFFPSVISDAFPRSNKITGWTWKVDTDFIGWSFLPNEVWNRWTCARVAAGLNTCSEIPLKGTDVVEFCYWFIHLSAHGRIKSSSVRSLDVSAKPCTSVINSKACLQRAPSLALRRGHAGWTHSLISYSLSELCAVMNFSCA